MARTVQTDTDIRTEYRILREIANLDRQITALARRADAGPHSLAHAALAAGLNASLLR